MFHTPLQLPHDIVVADNEVLLSELSCLYGLLYVISGLLAGGSPGFRIVLCCFTHFPSVAMFVMAFLCFGVCVCLLPYPDRVDTMLSPLRSLLDVAELASQSHSLLVLLVFCFGGLFVFVLFCVFFVCLLFVCGCFACDGCWDYVSVHASSTFEALFNCLRQCFN